MKELHLITPDHLTVDSIIQLRLITNEVPSSGVGAAGQGASGSP